MVKVDKISLKIGENYIFQNLSFEIKKGDFFCIVGENGSGKTSLVRCILGLQKYSGKIKITNGIYVGYVPQSNKIPENFPASVFEVVESGTLNRKNTTSERAKRVNNALKALKIEKLKTSNFSELSGGQKQKALIARALAASDDLIILDEPTNSLDQKSRKELYKMLKKLNSDGVTIVMVTHDLDHIDHLNAKIFSMSYAEDNNV